MTPSKTPLRRGCNPCQAERLVQGYVLPDRVFCICCSAAQALDHPEQAKADLSLITGGLTAPRLSMARRRFESASEVSSFWLCFFKSSA